MLRAWLRENYTLPYEPGEYLCGEVFVELIKEHTIEMFKDSSQGADRYFVEDVFHEASQGEGYYLDGKIAYDIGQDRMQSQIISMLANRSGPSKDDRGYNSDYFLVTVDNCCSRCITKSMTDFVSAPVKVHIRVRGIGGMTSLQGTVKWKVEDNAGQVHTLTTPDTSYNADAPYRLLLPQHRSQVEKENLPRPRGMLCATYDDAIELFWNQRKLKSTIKLNADSNIALMHSAPGYSCFDAFGQAVQKIETTTLKENKFYSLPAGATSVTDNKESQEEDPDCTKDDDNSSQELGCTGTACQRHPELPDEVITQTDSPNIPEDEDVQPSRQQHRPSFFCGTTDWIISQLPRSDRWRQEEICHCTSATARFQSTLLACLKRQQEGHGDQSLL